MSKALQQREALDAALRHVDEAFQAVVQLSHSNARYEALIRLSAVSGYLQQIKLDVPTKEQAS